MNAEAMIDTNVLVYAASVLEGDRVKTKIAQDLLFDHSIGLSSRVLQEFIVVSTRKVRKDWKPDDALDWIEVLEDFPCPPTDAALVHFGGELAIRYQLSYWDGAILAAAHRLDASILYSEDLNHGQVYGSVRVENPFRPH
jgi:predicted nucleic acid-binding protein